MRVIGGVHRSRPLLMVESEKTRETKDRVKETIFNMIGPYQSMDDVLDLFAGSGSLGIEACSRGAKRVVYVDNAFAAIDVVKKNIKSIGLEDYSVVIKQDAFDYLLRSSSVFDVVFLDPPYNSVSIDQLINMIGEKSILKRDGLIVVLSDKDTVVSETSDFVIVKQKHITRTNVCFLKWRN